MKNAEKNGECKKAWLKTHQKSVKMVYDVPIFCGVYYMRGFLRLESERHPRFHDVDGLELAL